MKTFTLLTLVSLCFSINAYAGEITFVAQDNKNTTKICLSAVTDNTEVMISKLRMLSQRGTALSFRSFVNTIQCNNQYIGNFAKTYGAQSTFEYLDKYTNKWNKNRQSNITISDIAKAQGNSMDQDIVVLVASN